MKDNSLPPYPWVQDTITNVELDTIRDYLCHNKCDVARLIYRTLDTLEKTRQRLDELTKTIERLTTKEGYLYISRIKCPDCKSFLYLYHTDLGGRIVVCRTCSPNGFGALAQLAGTHDVVDSSFTPVLESIRAKAR